MARIRSAKPEFWTDPAMLALPRDVRFTFKGLWEVCADDDGRFLADARIVKGQVWPVDDDITPRKLAAWLDTLQERGRIVLYDVAGARYGAIVNWLKHQKISHPTPSKHPPPPQASGKVPEIFPNGSGPIPESFRPDVERDVDGDEEKKRSGAEAEGANSAAAAPLPEPPGTKHDLRAADPARPQLPAAAERFIAEVYSQSTPGRRLDVKAQLQDAIDPMKRGARIRKGAFVRARSPEHLASVCEAVRQDPPRDVNAAIVWVLRKLQDPPPGPSPAELVAMAESRARSLEERYTDDARRAALAWAKEHPDDYAAIARPVEQQFGSSQGTFAAMARDSALLQVVARAAGFPPFDDWAAQRAHPLPS